MIIEREKDRGPALLLYIIYTLSKYIYLKSRWLKYSKVEDGLYPMAGGANRAGYHLAKLPLLHKP